MPTVTCTCILKEHHARSPTRHTIVIQYATKVRSIGMLGSPEAVALHPIPIVPACARG